MKKGIFIYLLVLAIGGWFGRDVLWLGYKMITGQGPAMVEMGVANPAVTSVTKSSPNSEDNQRRAYDIVLHTPEQIFELLQHTEQIASAPRSATEQASIAMVLHGPEIDFFSIENYPRYKDIVDLAARLDAYNVIEVKMCQTMMRKRGLKNENVPGFIELVPYAPEELEKLRRSGYVVL